MHLQISMPACTFPVRPGTSLLGMPSTPQLWLCASAWVLLVLCSLCVQVKLHGLARLQAPSVAPGPACAAKYLT